ncbi:MAG: hypothetical protein PHN42_03855 [Bacilli bacterium]|nr:hypothetical protein [Bacilli bacterium]
MTSRMDRYYKPETNIKKRSQKNEQLYRNIYENAEYSNIEGIATIEKGNEIDINKVKNMIKNREDYLKQREIKGILSSTKESVSIKEIEDIEEKNYDIRDILDKAKINKNTEDKYRTLNNTNYDIFKDLRDKRRKEIEKEGETENELRELIDTITSTSALNKMEDKELSLDLLDDLKSTGNTTITAKDSIKALLEEARNLDKAKDHTKPEMDKSFYTSSLNFKDDDFEQLANLNNNLKKNNVLMKTILFIVLASIALIIIISVFNMTK